MERHVWDCPECVKQFIEFRETLEVFRESVREWSEEYESHTEEAAALSNEHRFSNGSYMWFATAATLLIILASTLRLPYHRDESHRTTTGQSAALLSDEALFSQLDQEVSRTVPRSMEPLAQMVSPNGPASWSAANGSAEKE
jgi:hypothetical protein